MDHDDKAAEEYKLGSANFELCIKCQKVTSEDLVEPKINSYETFLTCIRKRAEYLNQDYPQILSRIGQHATVDDLVAYNARWHRSCYQSATHLRNVTAAQDAYASSLQTGAKRKVGRPQVDRKVEPKAKKGKNLFLRSSGQKLERDKCFFCDENDDDAKLHQVSNVRSSDAKTSTGKQIYQAVMNGNNAAWKVKIQALDNEDLLSIDLKYHLKCYVKEVQRAKFPAAEEEMTYSAADIEFFTLLESLLQDNSSRHKMSDLTTIYSNIQKKHGIEHPGCSEFVLKGRIQRKMNDVVFSKGKQTWYAMLPKSQDLAVHQVEESSRANPEMQPVIDCAAIIRKDILSLRQGPWSFAGDLLGKQDIPNSLHTLLELIIQGFEEEAMDDKPKHDVEQKIMNIAQILMHEVETDRQAKHKTKQEKESSSTPSKRANRHALSSENRHVLGIGLRVHAKTRSRHLVTYLHSCGVSVGYDRILQLESQLAEAILKNIREVGVHIPSGLVKGQPVFFAADNIDFEEDTVDGRNTFHGTVLVVFQHGGKQIKNTEPANLPLSLSPPYSHKTVLQADSFDIFLPRSVRPQQSLHYKFSLASDDDELLPSRNDDLMWLTAQYSQRNTSQTEDATVESLPLYNDPSEINQNSKHPVPSWAAYNSMLHPNHDPLTCIRALPLITLPAHESQTLLMVLTQARKISSYVVGEEHKTIITLDMDLYQRALKLQSSMPNLQNQCILRVGEFHTVLCMLRTIGSFVENSGIDEAWEESGLFGQKTVRQIIEGRHMKRAINAHITTLQVLFDIYAEVFFDKESMSDFVSKWKTETDVLAKAFEDREEEQIRISVQKLTKLWETEEMQQKLVAFDSESQVRPMFKWFRTYMEMVLTMMQFIRATRLGLWQLHLASLEKFCKYFFSQNRLKYSQFIPEYLAKMKSLEDTDPIIWNWFNEGNFSVTKTKQAFCKLGVDHALEQVNRGMKVSLLVIVQ